MRHNLHMRWIGCRIKWFIRPAFLGFRLPMPFNINVGSVVALNRFRYLSYLAHIYEFWHGAFLFTYRKHSMTASFCLNRHTFFRCSNLVQTIMSCVCVWQSPVIVNRFVFIISFHSNEKEYSLKSHRNNGIHSFCLFRNASMNNIGWKKNTMFLGIQFCLKYDIFTWRTMFLQWRTMTSWTINITMSKYTWLFNKRRSKTIEQ